MYRESVRIGLHYAIRDQLDSSIGEQKNCILAIVESVHQVFTAASDWQRGQQFGIDTTGARASVLCSGGTRWIEGASQAGKALEKPVMIILAFTRDWKPPCGVDFEEVRAAGNGEPQTPIPAENTFRGRHTPSSLSNTIKFLATTAMVFRVWVIVCPNMWRTQPGARQQCIKACQDWAQKKWGNAGLTGRMITVEQADQRRWRKGCGLHRSDTNRSLHYIGEVWFKGDLWESTHGRYWHIPPNAIAFRRAISEGLQHVVLVDGFQVGGELGKSRYLPQSHYDGFETVPPGETQIAIVAGQTSRQTELDKTLPPSKTKPRGGCLQTNDGQNPSCLQAYGGQDVFCLQAGAVETHCSSRQMELEGVMRFASRRKRAHTTKSLQTEDTPLRFAWRHGRVCRTRQGQGLSGTLVHGVPGVPGEASSDV
ncbi:uncharacterized protein STEHIDRAFT_108226 [Stereum hirsutum FP-91666 SS1]|uniref:uncharacterized protein n=1 Tax=Stereum hirsutum (strain FP-91666) TaxID=721885 RepID=UPI000440BD13|nr:uncharacterized protein STEHIDRAFT_108226 [Stereum hirsutum FP-91666 SS1]EIM89504.1 hypothetical protein STEHIDRAFT_108226 [Stereum hirsutum FP-91666 SS1]